MLQLSKDFPDTYELVQKDGVDRVLIGDLEDVKNLIKELKSLIKEKNVQKLF